MAENECKLAVGSALKLLGDEGEEMWYKRHSSKFIPLSVIVCVAPVAPPRAG